MDVAVSTAPSLAADDRLSLLKRHGSFALSYSVAFQPGLKHFGDEQGFLSYGMVGRTAFVLSDPMAPRERHGDLIDAFVEEKGDVTFWQISQETAKLLHERGFSVNALGVESIVDLASYTFRAPIGAVSEPRRTA